MQVKFAHTLPFVKNIEVSKRFYHDLLGIGIIQDYGVFIHFEGDFTIHQTKELHHTIFGEDLASTEELQGKKNLEIYFESDDLNTIYDKLVKNGVPMIHPIKEQPWGQKVFRFYDPDGHIVEIGEPSFKTF